MHFTKLLVLETPENLGDTLFRSAVAESKVLDLRHDNIPVLQLGDPALRRKCAEVPVEKIKGKEVQDVLAAMHAALIR